MEGLNPLNTQNILFRSNKTFRKINDCICVIIRFIQGKMPILVTNSGFPVIESDCIARYLLDSYPNSPSFVPSNIYARSLSDQICRVHDMYISPIQGCMYRAPGSLFGMYGTNRSAALTELKRQLVGIDGMLSTLDTLPPSEYSKSQSDGPYLCGGELSLADITLYPTILFCVYMLPAFFGWSAEQFMSPRLRRWYSYMSAVPEVRQTAQEITGALDGWRVSGRWDAIVLEMQQLTTE